VLNLFGNSSNFTHADAARLRRIEQKLDLLLKHSGIPFDDINKALPDEAQDLADRGEKIAAIKAYREATGAGLVEAKEAVEVYMAHRGIG
jgi:hypothetical protein